MSNLMSCMECEAIAQELREAYAEAWTSSDQASKDAWIATYKMIGGTDDDAVRAEELVSAAKSREPRRINQVLCRKFAHEVRSGHKVAWVV